MAVQKRITMTSIGVWTGAILGVLAIGVYARGLLDARIDERIDSKLVKVIMYLEEISTPEQKKCVDERYERWNNKQ